MKKLIFKQLLMISVMSLGISQFVFADKKAGESCEYNDDCETNSCKNHQCEACPDGDHCPKPGMCTELGLAELTEKVSNYCKGPEFSCQGIADFSTDDVECSLLKERLETADQCASSRLAVMKECFKGGDRAHRDKYRNIIGVKQYCAEVLNYKQKLNLCYTCSQETYKSLKDKINLACDKDWRFSASTDSMKIDCLQAETVLQNNQSCLDARNQIVTDCFNGKEHHVRQYRREERERVISRIKEVIDFKRKNNACK